MPLGALLAVFWVLSNDQKNIMPNAQHLGKLSRAFLSMLCALAEQLERATCMKGLSGFLCMQQCSSPKSLFQSSNCKGYSKGQILTAWLELSCSEYRLLVIHGCLLKALGINFLWPCPEKSRCIFLIFQCPCSFTSLFLVWDFSFPSISNPEVIKLAQEMPLGRAFSSPAHRDTSHNPGQELVKLPGYFWGNVFNYAEHILSHTAKSSSAQGWCKRIQETWDAKNLKLWRKYLQVDMAANWSEFSSLGSVLLTASIWAQRIRTQTQRWLHWELSTQNMRWNAASQIRAENIYIFFPSLCDRRVHREKLWG